MDRRFSLKYKLIFHTLFFVIAAMLIVGGGIDYQLRSIFYDDAKEQMHETLLDISSEMKHTENNLLESVYAIGSNESVMASLYIINTYQDIRDYNAILFDEEKKRIAQILLNEGKFTYNDNIAVYDNQNRLVAFVSTTDKGVKQGYASYREGKVLFFIRTHRTQEYEESSLPSGISYRLVQGKGITPFKLQSGGVIYKVIEDDIEIEGNSAILILDAKGERKTVGFMQANKTLTHEAMHKISKSRHIQVDYVVNGSESSSADLEFYGKNNFHKSPLLFSKFSVDEIILVETEELFYGAAQLLVENTRAYMVATMDRHMLNVALYEGRKTLVWIFGAVFIFIMLVSVFFVHKMVSVPLQKLMRGIDILQNGEYTQKVRIETNDELGLIADRFNEMAHKVHEREMALDKLAHHDILTQMPNRAMFQKRLGSALSRAERLDAKGAVLFFDLDQFKSINDTLGHDVGDQLLIEVSERLSNLLRKNDLLARIGGDEFNILIEDLDSPVTVEEIAKKILEQIKVPFTVGDEELQISCSIGISLFPDDAMDVNTLMKNADLAMYKAKELGRDQYHFFSSVLSRSLKERTAMLKALRGALSNDELKLFYQPKFSLEDGSVHAAEALIRWESPIFGFVTPERFIPLCEESGLIVQFGRWVLRRACEDFTTWQKLGLPVAHISVNVSNVQFIRSDMVSTVKEVLEATGVSPGSLELEITESYIHDAGENAMRVLHDIRDIGVDLAIDDFGTGYSSMSYLKLLPLTRLKIDRSFIMDIPEDSNDVEITKAIVALAKVMNLRITAEGVETVEQMRFLKALECDEGQGYLCSKPIDNDSFMVLMKDGPCCVVDYDE